MPSVLNATTTNGIAVQGDNSGALALQTNNGTTAVTIDTSQRVLIGATSASGLDSGADDLVVGAGSGSTGMTIYSGNTSVGGINFADGNTGSAIYAGGLNYNHNINRMSFYTTDGTGRMYIDSSGNVLIGGTGANGKLCVFGDNADWNINSNVAGSAGGTKLHIRFIGDSALTGSITSSGTNTSYNTSSDYRLKEDIAPMVNALATVSALKPVTYKWKADGSNGQGFIAHELQAVVPDCVTGEKDAMETYKDEDGVEQTRINPQGIDTSYLVATLTAAIQELNAKVEAQAVRIAELEGAK